MRQWGRLAGIVAVVGATAFLPRSIGSLQAAPLPKHTKCGTTVMDSIGSTPALYTIHDNATAQIIQIQPNHQGSLPNQLEPVGALQASPSDAGSTFSAGRRFPMPENWTCGKAVSFWFHGTGSGKKVALTVQGQSAKDPGPSGWQLAWSDEFNGPAGAAPDPSVWGHDTGGGGWGNHELEYYTSSTDNAALDGQGNLLITVRKADPSQNLSCWYGDCQYTSARLLTEGNVAFGYGRIEARIKIPSGAGYWPAFWLLGTNINQVGWPQCGETDIMENVGRLPTTLYGTLHGPGYEGAGYGGSYDSPAPLAADYHVYAVDWTPNQVSWSIDGQTYFTAKRSSVPGQWVFSHPMFVILNVAVGGDFGQAVDPSTVFPQSMAVDYVRYSTAPDTAQRFTAAFTDKKAGWQHVTIPLSSFKPAGAQPSGAPRDARLKLGAVWGYEFIAPAGLSAMTVADLHVARKLPKKK
ncbi:MAG TPA: family 16 glycosylhydrolase [Chloroflexota bacterium]|nr:family 16 glycosylhydrolase [Chloroflexota bacterium]